MGMANKKDGEDVCPRHLLHNVNPYISLIAIIYKYLIPTNTNDERTVNYGRDYKKTTAFWYKKQ